MNAPAAGPVFDVFDVLNGVVDLRSYPRRILVINVRQTVTAAFGPKQVERALLEPIIHLTNGIEFLETQGWQLVSVVNRELGEWCYPLAFLRRT
ncbi:hypothetical protein [Nocardia sp. XZ_19_385]|uniref:hypothetical protein n=1 Tax=Nocardia sp. XZ_19_385 TaxID=2769488 RepID=UPI00188F2C8B|nr:hypothetical protein [Nocardia sp. XZ_19_385]